MLALTQSTAPTVEPVTIAEAKEHLRVTFDDDNAYIGTLIKAARKRIEDSTHRQLIQATWTYTIDSFPSNGEILLPVSPLSSVTSVKYYDTNSTQQTLATSVYDTDTTTIVPRIFLKYNQTWPASFRGHTNDIEIIFVAGYGTAPASVPETARQAILMLAAHWYEHREAVIVGQAPMLIPETIDCLVDTIRVPIVA